MPSGGIFFSLRVCVSVTVKSVLAVSPLNRLNSKKLMALDREFCAHSTSLSAAKCCV